MQIEGLNTDLELVVLEVQQPMLEEEAGLAMELKRVGYTFVHEVAATPHPSGYPLLTQVLHKPRITCNDAGSPITCRTLMPGPHICLYLTFDSHSQLRKLHISDCFQLTPAQPGLWSNWLDNDSYHQTAASGSPICTADDLHLLSCIPNATKLLRVLRSCANSK